MSLPADMLVVTVNYFTEAEIEALVASLAPQRHPWELVILDNGSSESGKSRLAQVVGAHANIHYHDCGANLGYFGAAHSYLRSVSADSLPQWLIVTNPDVVFDEDFLERLHQVDADVVAPRLLDAAHGYDLNPFMEQRPTRFYARSRRFIFANPIIAQAWIAASWLASKRRHRPRHVTSRTIYAGHGAVLAFRSSYFTGGGTLYHEPFLFGEELTVAENAREIGGRVYYAADVRARHIGHVTTAVRRSRQLLTYQRESTRYIDQLIRQAG